MSLTLKLFVALVVNTAMITILIKGNPNSVSSGSPADPIFRQFGVLEGGHGDFSTDWYLEVGSALMLTMIISIFTPQITKVSDMFTNWLNQCRDRGCRGIKHHQITHRSAQHDLEELYLGPELELEQMYAQQLNMIFICLMFNSGMPLLTIVCFFSLCVTYFFDKLTFLRLYRLPPAIDETAATTATATLKYALLLHVVIATWMWSNPDIVETENYIDFDEEVVTIGSNRTVVTTEQKFHPFNGTNTSTSLVTFNGTNCTESTDSYLCANGTVAGYYSYESIIVDEEPAGASQLSADLALISSFRVGSRILGSVQVAAYIPLLGIYLIVAIVTLLLYIFPDIFHHADKIRAAAQTKQIKALLKDTDDNHLARDHQGDLLVNDTDEENWEEGEAPFRHHVIERVDILREKLAADDIFRVTIAGKAAVIAGKGGKKKIVSPAKPMLGHGVAQAQWRAAGLAKAYYPYIRFLDRKLLQLYEDFPEQVTFGQVDGRVAGPRHYHVWGANAWNWNLADGEKIIGGGQANAFSVQKEGVFGIVTSAKHGPPNGDDLEKGVEQAPKQARKETKKEMKERREREREHLRDIKHENIATSEKVRKNIAKKELELKLKREEEKQLSLSYWKALPVAIIQQRLALNHMDDRLLEKYDEELHRRSLESGTLDKQMDGLETYDMWSNSHYVSKFALDSSAILLHKRGKLKVDYARYIEDLQSLKFGGPLGCIKALLKGGFKMQDTFPDPDQVAESIAKEMDNDEYRAEFGIEAPLSPTLEKIGKKLTSSPIQVRSEY